MRVMLTSVAWLLVLTVVLPAQLPCSKCKEDKWVECTKKDHEVKKARCSDATPHKCTAKYSAPCCRGLLKVPCPKCKDIEARAEFSNQMGARAAWVKARRDEVKDTGIRMSIYETDRVAVYNSITRWKTKKRSLTMDSMAHVFGERLTKAANRFTELVDPKHRQQHKVVLLANPKEMERYTLLKMGGGYRFSMKQYSPNGGTAVQWPNPVGDLKDDDEFHAHTIHNLVHLMSRAAYGWANPWPNQWVDVGIAHWIENDIMEFTHTFCFEEVQGESRWEGDGWENKIANEVAKGQEIEFASMQGLEPDRMHHRDHAYAWSFVDFLIKEHRSKFPELFKALKQEKTTAKAIDKVLGWSTASFQDHWKAFVKKNYRTK